MNIKVAAIGAVCAAAVGVLIWQGSAQFGPREIRSAKSAQRDVAPIFEGPGSDGANEESGRHRVEIGGPRPAWIENPPGAGIESYTFPSTGGAVGAFDQASTVLPAKFDDDTKASGVSPGGRLSAVESWVAFMRPLVSGDEEAFKASVERLGGVTEPGPEGDVPASRLFGRLSPIFDSAPVALEQARIRAADPNDTGDVPRLMPMPDDIKPQPGMVMMLIEREESTDEATGERSSTDALALPLQQLFPAAGSAAAGGARVVEVWAPAKVTGSGGKNPDLGTSVYLAWNNAAHAWQPVAMRVVFLSDKGRSKLEFGERD